jgi:superfamily II DNA/RNA helicase
MPSDLGGDDTGFILPPLNYHVHKMHADVTVGADDGCLFRMPDNSATSVHKEKRLTLEARVRAAADIANATTDPVIVWCETNDESTALTKMINGAIEVRGSMTADQKEAALDRFSLGQERVIVTKPKVAGFGLNWQHANCVVFASISHSYEQHYQAIRRSWRFGQKKQVDCHVVISDTEYPMWSNVRRKASDHMKMKSTMAKSMSGAQESSTRKSYDRENRVIMPKFITGEA